ncbi:uncharacterized protein [Amphiura filiformis]|uniref:uncharacterized protein n=1 Tax=Amphiura filiformis TaxID=82378 RepID=UPI003B22141D
MSQPRNVFNIEFKAREEFQMNEGIHERVLGRKGVIQNVEFVTSPGVASCSEPPPFDCTLLDAAAFSNADETKCYLPDLTQTRTWEESVSYCQNLNLHSYDWHLINPKNNDENGLLKTKFTEYATSPAEWWIGQNDRFSELVFKNLNDPEECPGVFLDWRINSQSQPNGGIDGQADEDCITFQQMDNYRALQDKDCTHNFGVLCKAATDSPSHCLSLHAAAIPNTVGDPQSCYIAKNSYLGQTGVRATFTEAVTFCSNLALGGLDWAVPDVRDLVEVNFLRDTTANGGAGLPFDSSIYYYVGQNDRDEEHVWVYLNQPVGCAPVFLDFIQPNDITVNDDEDCIAMRADVGMTDYACNDNSISFYTMCEMTIPDFQVTSITTAINVNANTYSITCVITDYNLDIITWTHRDVNGENLNTLVDQGTYTNEYSQSVMVSIVSSSTSWCQTTSVLSTTGSTPPRGVYSCVATAGSEQARGELCYEDTQGDAEIPAEAFMLEIPLQGKPTSQSSNIQNGGTSEKAVDGNTDGIYQSGSCTHTNAVCDSDALVDLGMASEVIPDGKITASDSFNGLPAHEGRLNGADYWATQHQNSAGSWIQVELQNTDTIVGIRIQGSGWQENEWVEKLQIKYGNTEASLEYIMDNSAPKTFDANSDKNTVVYIEFPQLISAKFLRILPTQWHNWAALRFEVVGCDNDRQWWTVDMEESWCVGKVAIYNRVDCCSSRLDGAVIRVGSNSAFENNLECESSVSSEQIQGSQIIEIECNLQGRYLSVELPLDKRLALCEVKAYMCENSAADLVFPLTISPDDATGHLGIDCYARNPHDFPITWYWFNTLTQTVLSLDSNIIVQISTQEISKCRWKSEIILLDFINSIFDDGTLVCGMRDSLEIWQGYRSLMIEKGKVLSLDSGFDASTMQLHLACVVIGTSQPQVRWTFGDDTYIDDQLDKYTVTNTVNASTLYSTLTINNYDPHLDDGSYACNVEAFNFTVDQESVLFEMPKITSVTRTHINDYTLTCAAQGYPAFEVTWSWETNDKHGSPTYQETQTGSVRSDNGTWLRQHAQTTLIVSNFQQNDNSSEYCCTVMDNATDATIDRQCIAVGCECDTGYIYWSGSCYQYVDEIKTFQDAERHCADEDAHVVAIESHREQEFLATNSHFPTGYWIGLFRDPVPKWHDSSLPLYTNYVNDDLTYSCFKIVMDNDHKWLNRWCGGPIHFMCEKELVQITSNLTSPIYGEDVSLSCHVVGACARFGITWQHQSFLDGNISITELSGDTTENEAIQDGSLIIANYDEEDEGIYNCIVKMNNDTIVSPDTLVIAPRISTTSDSYDHLNNIYTLTCDVIGNPAPNITWVNGQGVIVDNGGSHQISTNVRMDSYSPMAKFEILTSTLQLSGFQYNPSNKDYTCSVMVSDNTVKEKMTTIRFPPVLLSCNDSLNGSCYVAVQETVDWETAKVSCEKNYNGILVFVENQEEKEFIIQLMQRDLTEYPGSIIWLGAKRSESGSEVFYTVDGSVHAYDYFGGGEPSTASGRDCMAHDIGSDTAVAKSCNTLAGYICKYNQNAVKITSVIGTLDTFNGQFMLRCDAISLNVPTILWTRNGDNITTSVPQRYQLGQTVTETDISVSSTLVLLDVLNEMNADFRCVALVNEHLEGDTRRVDVDCPWQETWCEYFFAETDMCYASIAQSVSWDDGEAYCNSVYNGHLTDVSNVAELDFLNTFASNDFDGIQSGPGSSVRAVWVGIRQVSSEWRAIDGTIQTYLNWANAQAHDNHCVALSVAPGKFVDADCSTPQIGFVCKYENVLSVGLASQSSAVSLGGRMELACTLNKACTSSIHWEFRAFDSQDITSKQGSEPVAYFDQGVIVSTLLVESFSEQDIGTYTCYANLTNGAHAMASVNVSWVNVDIVSTTCLQNTTTVLCQASAHFNPVIKWYTAESWLDADSNDVSFTVTETRAGNTLSSWLTVVGYEGENVFCRASEQEQYSVGFAEECLMIQNCTSTPTTMASRTTEQTTTPLPTTLPGPTTTPPTTTLPTTTLPTTTMTTLQRTTTLSPCMDVDGIDDLEFRVNGRNICITHTNFLRSTNRAVMQEIEDGLFTADKIDEVFNYVHDAPILESGDIEAAAVASEEVAKLSSTLLDVPSDQDAVETNLRTLSKSAELLHGYSKKLPTGNCLTARSPGLKKYASDFCNVNSPDVLKYFEFRVESSYSSDGYDDKLSVDWELMPDIVGGVEAYFVASHARIEPSLPTTEATKTKKKSDDSVELLLNSDTVSFTMWYNESKLSVPCYINLQHKQKVTTRIPTEDDDVAGGTLIKESICVFWDEEAGNWSRYGCEKVDGESSAYHTSCYCNHSTSFALLMHVWPHQVSKTQEISILLIAYIGCGVSLLMSVLTLWVFFHLRWYLLYSEATFVHINLIFALILVQCIFLAGVEHPENEKTCKVVAVLLHLAYLAVFAWLLVEGVHLYLKVLRVFGAENKQLMPYLIIGWGVPLVITGISFGAGYDGYGSENSCWLDTNSGLIWAFAAPVLFLVLVNLMILGLIVRVIIQSSEIKEIDAHYFTHVKSGVKGVLVLLPIFGITWTLGLIAVNSETIMFIYLFAIFNSLQGVFIFVVYCILNAEVRMAWRKKKAEDQKIELAKTAVPEGAMVTAFGTVVFKMAGEPVSDEMNTNSAAPSPTPSRSSRMNEEPEKSPIKHHDNKTSTNTPTEPASNTPNKIQLETPTQNVRQAPTQTRTDTPTKILLDTPAHTPRNTTRQSRNNTPTEPPSITPAKIPLKGPAQTLWKTPTQVSISDEKPEEDDDLEYDDLLYDGPDFDVEANTAAIKRRIQMKQWDARTHSCLEVC